MVKDEGKLKRTRLVITPQLLTEGDTLPLRERLHKPERLFVHNAAMQSDVTEQTCPTWAEETKIEESQ